MEAHAFRAVLMAAAILSSGAAYRTENFVVSAPEPQLAQEVGDLAERFRRDLAIEWLGKELPRWGDSCPVTVAVGPQLGAGGVTSFMFHQGRPFGWRMNIQGSRERILDSVLPHEITHTIFATHFGRPLPRWADEGACTTVEHLAERKKQDQMLVAFLTTGRGIAFNHMFAMREYPHDMLPLYSQGYSLARFLIDQGGRRRFVDYVGDGMKWNNWTAATKRHYGFDSLSELQLTWVDWVRRGSPPLQPKAGPSSPLQGAAAIAQAASGGEGGPGTASAGRSTPAETTGSSGDSLVPVPRIASSQTRGDDSSGSVQAGETVATRQEHGWYARQRDRALAGRGRSASASFVRVATSAAGFHELNPPDNTTAVEQQLIRPQPMGRPQQVIVEWGPPPGRPSPPAPTAYSPSLPAPPPPSRFDAPVGQAATVWR